MHVAFGQPSAAGHEFKRCALLGLLRCESGRVMNDIHFSGLRVPRHPDMVHQMYVSDCTGLKEKVSIDTKTMLNSLSPGPPGLPGLPVHACVCHMFQEWKPYLFNVLT